jgi:tRNA pseudouridine38-40 synthase
MGPGRTAPASRAGDRVIRLDLAYDGTGFRGWARQRGGVRTVEGELTDALGRLLGSEPKLSVAGRTDAGVHAAGQVASFVVPASPDVDLDRMQRSLNGILGPEVGVQRVRWAPAGFNARFSATAREYRYRIDTADTPDPFTARFVWRRAGPLALGPMRRAAGALVGERDFASFCRSPNPPSTTVRNLRRLSVSVEGSRVDVRAEANAFLHQMVRSLVGTLVAVGEGRIGPEEVGRILAARDRSAAGPIAPPVGLTLVRVRYGR